MKKSKIEEIPHPTEIELEKDEEVLKKIKDKWNDLREIAKEDLKDPPDNDFNLPSISVKWLGYRSDWIEAYEKFNDTKEKLERKLRYEYRYNMDMKPNDKEDELFLIRTDPRIINLNRKCKRISGLLNYIDSVIELLKQKHYLIKEYNIRMRYLKGNLD